MPSEFRFLNHATLSSNSLSAPPALAYGLERARRLTAERNRLHYA